jgi:phosphoglycolate phosphatase-like HAD superfamily hydrolase
MEVQRLLTDFGVEISYQAYEVARSAVFILDAPKRRIEGWTDFLALLFARMDARVSVDLLTSLTAMFESRNEMELFPDALEAVEAAKSAGLVTCAFTTLPIFMLGPPGPATHLAAGLARRAASLGPPASPLVKLLDHYFDCSALGVAKGDRRFYQRITERLCVDPEQILCVGDDPIGDCQLPSELGWQSVLLDRTGRHADVQVGQITTIASLSEFRQHS